MQCQVCRESYEPSRCCDDAGPRSQRYPFLNTGVLGRPLCRNVSQIYCHTFLPRWEPPRRCCERLAIHATDKVCIFDKVPSSYNSRSKDTVHAHVNERRGLLTEFSGT